MKKLLALFICLFTLALGGCAKDTTFSEFQAIQNQETYSYVLRTRVLHRNEETHEYEIPIDFYCYIEKTNNEFTISYSKVAKNSEEYQELGSFKYINGQVTDVNGEEPPIPKDAIIFDNYVFEKSNFKKAEEPIYQVIDDLAFFKGEKYLSGIDISNYSKDRKGLIKICGYTSDGDLVHLDFTF